MADMTPKRTPAPVGTENPVPVLFSLKNVQPLILHGTNASPTNQKSTNESNTSLAPDSIEEPATKAAPTTSQPKLASRFSHIQNVVTTTLVVLLILFVIKLSIPEKKGDSQGADFEIATLPVGSLQNQSTSDSVPTQAPLPSSVPPLSSNQVSSNQAVGQNPSVLSAVLKPSESRDNPKLLDPPKQDSSPTPAAPILLSGTSKSGADTLDPPAATASKALDENPLPYLPSQEPVPSLAVLATAPPNEVLTPNQLNVAKPAIAAEQPKLQASAGNSRHAETTQPRPTATPDLQSMDINDFFAMHEKSKQLDSASGRDHRQTVLATPTSTSGSGSVSNATKATPYRPILGDALSPAVLAPPADTGNLNIVDTGFPAVAPSVPFAGQSYPPTNVQSNSKTAADYDQPITSSQMNLSNRYQPTLKQPAIASGTNPASGVGQPPVPYSPIGTTNTAQPTITQPSGASFGYPPSK